MPSPTENKLDNPVWHSLNEMHSEFSLVYKDLKCYKTEFSPFGGYENNTKISEQIDEYAKLIDIFFIVGQKPEFSENLILKKELVCLQMVIENKIDSEIQERIVRLNDKYEEELFDLVSLVQPGYFKRKTLQLGSYYGIFKEGALIAATGERMKMNNFTEVSAVVTHPGHMGKGYAKQLITHAVNKIFEENKVPYLHVAETNIVPVQLYNKLGFTTRRKISFWNFQNNSFTK
jgi:ribosomal protein S18 acetylase RimI-like enzyme